jgi:hypothetical protein
MRSTARILFSSRCAPPCMSRMFLIRRLAPPAAGRLKNLGNVPSLRPSRRGAFSTRHGFLCAERIVTGSRASRRWFCQGTTLVVPSNDATRVALAAEVSRFAGIHRRSRVRIRAPSHFLTARPLLISSRRLVNCFADFLLRLFAAALLSAPASFLLRPPARPSFSSAPSPDW